MKTLTILKIGLAILKKLKGYNAPPNFVVKAFEKKISEIERNKY